MRWSAAPRPLALWSAAPWLLMLGLAAPSLVTLGLPSAAAAQPPDDGVPSAAPRPDEAPAVAQPPGSAPAPTQLKVAVVVSGDPDPALAEAASKVREALGGTPELLLPVDSALTAALGGAPAPEADDGLDEVRALRRRLGISAGSDIEALVRLARLSGAVAVVVVRRDPEPKLEVFDVGRRGYFSGALSVGGAEDGAIPRFVTSRAKAAEAHAGEAGAARPREARAAAPEAAADRGPAEAGPSERRRFLRRVIAYGAAGALLLGLGVFLIVDRTQEDPAPIIRIRPGET